MNKLKTIIVLALLSIFTVSGFSATAFNVAKSFGGHTYFAIDARSRAEAETLAAVFGGHLLFLDSEEEYQFVDANFVQRGSGWWWTGHESAGAYWTNDGASGSSYLPSFCARHWNNTIGTYPVGPGATIVLGRLQITYRSTKWVTKGYQFSKTFTESVVCNALIEIE